ncbi:MAG: tetratricopeptide repeat protein [Pseudomonadota bacterium]
MILTTRRSDWGGRATAVEVDVLTPEAAVDFLLARSGWDDRVGTVALADALGHLPLALEHAGAFLRNTPSLTFARYQAEVERRLARAPRHADYPVSVAGTFTLAIEKAAAEAAQAADLMSLLCWFAPEQVPLYLFEGEAEGAFNPLDLDDAVTALASVSLIKTDPIDADTPAVTLHRLIALAERQRLHTEDRAEAAGQRAVALAAAHPKGTYNDIATWPRANQLSAHVQALFAAGIATGADTPSLLANAASFLHACGAYSLAEPLQREAIAIGERHLGRDHPTVANWLHNLCSLLEDLSRLDEAEAHVREALDIAGKALGDGHPNVAIFRTRLAGLLLRTARVGEAEVEGRAALVVLDAAFGSEHERTRQAVVVTADALEVLGRGEEARALRGRYGVSAAVSG